MKLKRTTKTKVVWTLEHDGKGGTYWKSGDTHVVMLDGNWRVKVAGLLLPRHYRKAHVAKMAVAMMGRKG